MLHIIDRYEINEEESCSIARGWGANLISWKTGGNEIIYCPEDLPQTAQKITGGGNPLLFPSIGRTWDFSTGEPRSGIYRIHGHKKSYFMPSHGILYFCEFNKIQESREGDSLTVVYEANVPDKVHEENYPFDVGFAQQYTLCPGSIELEAVITNKGSIPAPAAFGYHPYFRVSNPRREEVEVRLQVARRLFLTPDTVLLTGESEATDGITKLEPDVYYDHAFDQPTGHRMSLIDNKAGHAIHVDYDETFELFFVYSPDGSDFVCIEPWTRGLGAYAGLSDSDWERGKLIPVLQPGECRKHRAAFSVEILK